MVALAACEANHAEGNRREDGKNDDKKEENGVADGIPRLGEIHRAGRTSENVEWIHGGSEVELVGFFPEIETIDRYEQQADHSDNPEAGRHCRRLRSQHERPQNQKRAEERADCDENDVEAAE